MVHTTVIIPCALYHADVVDRALASVQAQTTPCETLLMTDYHQEGVAVMRNRGALQATTPYVVFLDADDTIQPDFVEKCESIIQDDAYVYTDWLEDETVKQAPHPREAWLRSTYHVVTTLLHRQHVLELGGFDEELPGGEDTDFYIRLRLYGIRGFHIPQPLFRYCTGGERSRLFVHGKQYRQTLDYFNKRYSYLNQAYRESDGVIHGEQQPGDVLVMAMWQGNRSIRGKMTGRNYPRCGNYKKLWIAPEDANAMPELYSRVEIDRVKLLPMQPTIITHPRPERLVEYTLQEAGQLLFSKPQTGAPRVDYQAGLPTPEQTDNLLQWVMQKGQDRLRVNAVC